MDIRRFWLLASVFLGSMTHGMTIMAQPPGRPAAIQAPEGGLNQPPAEAEQEAAQAANPLEFRYLLSYILLLAFVGGSTFLIIRPSGRATLPDAPTTAKGSVPIRK